MNRNCLAHELPGLILGCTDDETKPATKVLPENMAQLGRPLPTIQKNSDAFFFETLKPFIS
jgi:hypothetical protein